MAGVDNRVHYFLYWTAGLGTWAAVFWALRRRMGPVTFVERQIAHVWAASMASIALLFPVESLLGLPVLKLSPILALTSGMVFLDQGGDPLGILLHPGWSAVRHGDCHGLLGGLRPRDVRHRVGRLLLLPGMEVLPPENGGRLALPPCPATEIGRTPLSSEDPENYGPFAACTGSAI